MRAPSRSTTAEAVGLLRIVCAPLGRLPNSCRCSPPGDRQLAKGARSNGGRSALVKTSPDDDVIAEWRHRLLYIAAVLTAAVRIRVIDGNLERINGASLKPQSCTPCLTGTGVRSPSLRTWASVDSTK